MVCAVGTSPTGLWTQTRLPTTTPGETLARVIAFFQQQLAAPLAAVGCKCWNSVGGICTII